MSSPSNFPQSLKQQQFHGTDVVFEDSLPLNQTVEIPDRPGAPSNPDPDPETQEADGEEGEEEQQENEEEIEEDNEEGKEQETPKNPLTQSGMSLQGVPPITDSNVSVSDVTLASHSPHNPRRGGNKRKKGKTNLRKQQSIQRKLESLKVKFNPIPFIPIKLLDFSKHEKLLKKLGLWDFVHIGFDRNIRVDLISQLVATYDSKSQCGYVNDSRISLTRAHFARAFKLPLKKKANVGGAQSVELDGEDVSEDSIGFIVEFVSDWVLLHEETWIMPPKVVHWLMLIKDGEPETVDWAALFRFMVENELKQGDQLGDCYYASHLQYLMKFQHEKVFSREEDMLAEKVELEAETKEEEKETNEDDVMVGNAMVDGRGGESCLMSAPNIELTLGQDGEKEEIVTDVEMMDVAKCKENGNGDDNVDRVDDNSDGDDHDNDHVDEVDNREEVEEEQGMWLLHGKNNLGQHFLQPCNVEDGQGFGNLEDEKEKVEEMEGDGDEDEARGFDVFPAVDDLDGEGITGNFLQAMEANQVAFNSQEQLREPSSMDIRNGIQRMAPSSSFFNPAGKRVIEHDNDISHHSLNDSNKRTRINDSWNHKPVDFGSCMELIEQMVEKGRMLYEEKEQAVEQLNMNQQILLTELQKRDDIIEHLHKTRIEETEKKDGLIRRLERELYLLENVLDGYRKALKETQKVFAEYRQRDQLSEESTYKDAGPGGLMLSTAEIEKIRVKREEEHKLNCLSVEQKLKEAEENHMHQFYAFVDKIDILDKKLTDLEADAEGLIQSYKSRNLPSTEEKVDEVSTALPSE